ncbi:hypothetical protein C6T62_15170 [Burkholderia multivorans]|nr:hypothetical protein C6T62_15170 [Burkholderia multivorans]
MARLADSSTALFVCIVVVLVGQVGQVGFGFGGRFQRQGQFFAQLLFKRCLIGFTEKLQHGALGDVEDVPLDDCILC